MLALITHYEPIASQPSSAYQASQGQEDAQGCDKKWLHAISRGGDADSLAAAPGSPPPLVVAPTATGHCRNLAQEMTSSKDRGSCDAAASGTGSQPSIIFFALGWKMKASHRDKPF